VARVQIKRAEAAIQRAVVSWVPATWPERRVKVVANLNENSRHQMDMGVDVGRVDLELEERRDGVLHILYLELKTRDGALHGSQIAWATEYHEHYAASNTHYDVAYGFTDAKEKITKWMN